MTRLMTTMLTTALAVMFASSVHGIHLFDLAKDSHELVRGEFTALERTPLGDRLELRVDRVLNGTKSVGDRVWIEPYEPAYADRALGQDALVGFYESGGKYYLVWHPFSDRSVIMEMTDHAENGLDLNEQALNRFLQINQPYAELIRSEVMLRFEYEDLSYPGEFPQELINEWKAELLHQMSWRGTVAARDAAKAFVDHPLFRYSLTVDELRYVGGLVANSYPSTIERGYMLEVIRNEFSAHPSLPVLLDILREDRNTAVVGKLANIFNAVPDRGEVLTRLGSLASDRNQPRQVRCNALQVLGALADVEGIHWLHQTLMAEMEAGESFDKPVMRRLMMAYDATRDESSVEMLEVFFEIDICKNSWELTRRAWRAYSLIDSERTNARIRAEYRDRTELRDKRFFGHLFNAVTRELIMIHNED
jgi:hypothetical protein